MQKGTFGHMQKVSTQTSRRVSDVESGLCLHLLTLVTLKAQTFLTVDQLDYVQLFSISCRG